MSGSYKGVWTTDDITQAERWVVAMTYAEASFYLMFEQGFTIEMSSALIRQVSERNPRSRLAAHARYASLTYPG